MGKELNHNVQSTVQQSKYAPTYKWKHLDVWLISFVVLFALLEVYY